MVTPSSKLLSWYVLCVCTVCIPGPFFLLLFMFGILWLFLMFWCVTSKYKMWCQEMGKLKRVAMAWLQPVKKKKKILC